MPNSKFQKRTVFLCLYLVFALLPIYWMVNMSFKTNNEILAGFTLFPEHFTWANYETILTDPAWYSGYINSLIYVAMNTVMSLVVALPAAYAFSLIYFLIILLFCFVLYNWMQQVGTEPKEGAHA